MKKKTLQGLCSRNSIFNLLVLFVFLFSITTQAQSANEIDNPDYYGSQNQEARFIIQSYTYFGKSNGVPSSETIANDVKVKVKYILGYMRRSSNPAAIYPKYTVSTLKIEDTGSKYRVHYQISAKGSFQTGTTSYTFLIPISHSTIYERSEGKCTVADESKIDASIFWYHWFPQLAGCPLVENVDYISYVAQLNLINNTIITYPEYERLFQNGSLNMTTFFGVANYEATNWDPNTSSDIAAKDYLHQRQILVETYGMQSRVWSENEVRQYYNPSSESPVPYIEDLTRVTRNGRVNVRLFFGNTGLEHDSKAFHIFLRPALMNQQIIIYNGHSGIGKNLNLASIESNRGVPFSLSSNYQIYFLGSCAPYAYYTDMFFKRKISTSDPLGTKNLDLITFANESNFGNHYDDRLIQAVMNYSINNIKTTYQNIIGQDTRFGFGVNGDEDNPTQP